MLARPTTSRRLRSVVVAAALFAPFVAADPSSAETVDTETSRSSHASAVIADATDLTQLRQSDDYTTSDAEVLRLYRAFFLREPDITGAQYWIGLRRDGLAIEQISEYFSVSTEFGITYGELDDGAFVAQVYRNVFGREADTGGLAYWIGELTSGRLDRGGVVYWMTVNPEMVYNFPYAPLGDDITWTEARQAVLPAGTCDLVTGSHRTLRNARSVWTGPDGEHFRVAASRTPVYSEAIYGEDDDTNTDVAFIVECVEANGDLIDDGVVVWLSTQDPMLVDTRGNMSSDTSIAYHSSARWENVESLQVLTIDHRFYDADTPLCCPQPATDWYWELVDGRFEYIRT